MPAKFTKVLVAALVLAAASLTFVANASAGHGKAGWHQDRGESYTRERHDPTNTNGG